MNRTWKIISILYIVLTAPFVYLGVYWTLFIFRHHMYLFRRQPF